MAPKMMFASGWAASATRFAASLTSHSDMSRPPVIDSRIDRAPSTEVSGSGDATARSAPSIAGARPAAGAGGDEHHVRALQQRLDLIVLLHRGAVSELGVRPGAEPARGLVADMEDGVCTRLLERLQVGVDGDEVDALDAGLDH